MAFRRLFTAAVSLGPPPARNPSFRITSSADVTDLRFQGVPRPVRLICCADLLSEARVFFSTWPVREEGPSDVNPFLTIRRMADGSYRLESFRHTCGNDSTDTAHGGAPRDVGPDAGAPESRREASPACALCSLSIDLVSNCKNSAQNSAKNFCRIVREKTWFFANEPGYAAAKPLRIL